MTKELNTSINNSFEQEMLDKGYKIWHDNIQNSIRVFQRPIKDTHGTKYYINCRHWNHYKQGVTHDPQLNRDVYSFSVQFRVNEDTTDNTVSISFDGDMVSDEYREITSLDDIETFFENMFIFLKANYDESH